jgi:predicted N-acetyltransferase YhbS
MIQGKHIKLFIREEKDSDISKVSALIKESFKNDVTNLLVDVLRRRKDFIDEFSLVAEFDGKLVGYILLSLTNIETEQGLVPTLWLEPVCIKPEFQGKGIGSMIINEAISRASMHGFESVFVTGDFNYYSRFGFQKAERFGIYSSLYVPSEVFLGMELKENGLRHKGKLIYPQEIFDEI